MTTTRFTPTTYRRSITVFGLVAGAALGLGTAFEYPLVGVGLYALAMTAAVAVPSVADATLADERHREIHGRASGVTLALFGWLSAIVYPSLVVLSTTEHFAWGPASAAVAWTTVAVYGVYLLARGYYAAR